VDEANIIRHQWSPNSEVLGFSGKELCRAPNPEVSHTSSLALSCSRSCLRTRTGARDLCVSLPEPSSLAARSPKAGNAPPSPLRSLSLSRSLSHSCTRTLYVYACRRRLRVKPAECCPRLSRSTGPLLARALACVRAHKVGCMHVQWPFPAVPTSKFPPPWCACLY
jgi:hypothetical protein